MLYPPDNPDHSLLVPEGQGELLALLYPLFICRAELTRAEQEENYVACAQWAKAIESGLPFIPNAFMPLDRAVDRFQASEAVLIDDVHTPAELVFVLRQVADYWATAAEARQFGFCVKHLTADKYGYFFAAPVADDSPVLRSTWVLAYEGRFSS